MTGENEFTTLVLRDTRPELVIYDYQIFQVNKRYIVAQFAAIRFNSDLAEHHFISSHETLQDAVDDVLAHLGLGE